MAKIKDLSENEASKISDELEEGNTFLEKKYNEGCDSLWYLKDNLYYEIWITRDSSCWVVGGAVYDSIEDYTKQ